MSDPESFVRYDVEYPVCSNYAAWTNLRAVRPDIVPSSAREAPDLVKQVRWQGVRQRGRTTQQNASAVSVSPPAGSQLPRSLAPGLFRDLHQVGINCLRALSRRVRC